MFPVNNQLQPHYAALSEIAQQLSAQDISTLMQQWIQPKQP